MCNEVLSSSLPPAAAQLCTLPALPAQPPPDLSAVPASHSALCTHMPLGCACWLHSLPQAKALAFTQQALTGDLVRKGGFGKPRTSLPNYLCGFFKCYHPLLCQN